jgi:hypothetical protein
MVCDPGCLHGSDPRHDGRPWCETCDDTGKVVVQGAGGESWQETCLDCPRCWCGDRRGDGADHSQCHLIE